MEGVVNVKVVEDDSVSKKLNKFATKLSKKYFNARNINLKILKKKPLFLRVLFACINIICALVFGFSIIFCFSAVYNKVNNMPPSFAGFFNMQIVSGSMENDGFFKGDNVIVRSVDTKTLKPDDIIAFYAYSKSPKELKKISESELYTSPKYKVNLPKFFGILSRNIKVAAQTNCTLVFHHIKDIYVDESGNRYFTTYGSSNINPDTNLPYEDGWFISEQYVIGSYDNSNSARFTAFITKAFSSPTGVFLLLLVPVTFIIFSLIQTAFKNVNLAMLENDVVEEKRKLTDPICVENGIGYRMSKLTKYKVLAQASDDEKLEYVNLLWKTDNRPENIRKYYLRKDLVLRPMQKLRDVNRNCEQMFKDGVNPKDIAKYYTEEKSKIQKEQKRYKQLVKKIGENNKEARNKDDIQSNSSKQSVNEQASIETAKQANMAEIVEKHAKTKLANKPKTEKSTTNKPKTSTTKPTTNKVKTTKTTKATESQTTKATKSAKIKKGD